MLFCLSLPLFCKTTIPFYATKTSNFLVTHHFYGRIFVCAYQRFCLPCSCSLLFCHCRSFSPCWRSHFSFSHSLAAMKCSCFSSKESKFVSFVSFVGVPVECGRTGGRTVTWLQKFLGCIGYQIFLAMVLRCALRTRYNDLLIIILIIISYGVIFSSLSED